MWGRELRSWQQVPRTFRIIRSSADAEVLWGDVIIISYDLMARCLERLLKVAWDLVILDECQACKSLKAKRTMAVYGKRGLITRTQRMWILSGTPMPNNAFEIFPHYVAFKWGKLDPWAFEARYCITRETPFGKQIIGNNPARMSELADVLRPHMLQRRLGDVIQDMPEARIDRYPVTPDKLPPWPDLPPEVQSVIDRIMAKEDEDVDFEELLDAIPDEHLTTLRRWTGTAKAGLVAELVQRELEARDKIVVFGVFRNTLDLIAAALGADAKVINGSTPQSERQRLIDDFQTAAQPRVLVLQINTAGTSLTLTRASRVIVAEHTFAPADIVQAVRRCHRIGQRSSVYASIISLAGSFDDVVAGIVLRKANDIAQLEALVAGRA